ncbi:hypothetical protein AAG570_009146 [Ranatra chinensis]|uniref:Uncharacterized protein n=1 Tax=Ranatra chinensis TaxID=642074 RepID=A0ABD0YSW0_9HEMI
MASKRRNMFHENKAQETSEIEIHIGPVCQRCLACIVVVSRLGVDGRSVTCCTDSGDQPTRVVIPRTAPGRYPPPQYETTQRIGHSTEGGTHLTNRKPSLNHSLPPRDYTTPFTLPLPGLYRGLGTPLITPSFLYPIREGYFFISVQRMEFALSLRRERRDEEASHWWQFLTCSESTVALPLLIERDQRLFNLRGGFKGWTGKELTCRRDENGVGKDVSLSTRRLVVDYWRPRKASAWNMGEKLSPPSSGEESVCRGREADSQ